MHTLRTRFGKDIIAEFLPPARKTKQQRVIIICDGVPTVPAKKRLLEFWSKKGFWVFHPRYRGTWESSGSFLQLSPEKDILQIINQLPKGFTSLWDDKRFKIKTNNIFLFGNSFGGPAAILASRDERVTKAVLLAPVVDWIATNKTNSRDAKINFLSKAYGEAYRINKTNWEKLKKGNYYNPVKHIEEIDGKKLIIFQAKDDKSVPWRSVDGFAKATGSLLHLYKTGGHYGSSAYMTAKFYKKIRQFIA